ncbi:MAG: GDSL-type esterase/lipase family protein [Nitrospira sp.]|nr:GDSL-type esterase/lipase family protein [Nitrospira sp.]
MSRSALVVCFGDSLTVGFQSPTPENPTGAETPYGRFLQDRLGKAALVRISGACGELTGEMVSRFRRSVSDQKPDYVPILGGTNDLGCGLSPDEIMANLTTLYELTRNAGGVPIPVTVPSIRVEGSPGNREANEWVAGHLARRNVLNKLIRDYAASRSLALVDLFSATVDPTSGQLAARYSNDGLHLTTAGYMRFAEMIAHILLSRLQQTT